MSYYYDLCKKVIIIGDQGVGKSTLVHKLKTGKFNKDYTPSLELNVQPIYYGENIFHIWDVPGKHNDNKGICPYVMTDICIIMFDNTSEFSYSNITQWILRLKQYSPKAKIIIVRNKIDIHTTVNKDAICNFSISIKTGHGIDELVNTIDKKLYTTNSKL